MVGMGENMSNALLGRGVHSSLIFFEASNEGGSCNTLYMYIVSTCSHVIFFGIFTHVICS